jgi:hypothetical protein
MIWKNQTYESDGKGYAIILNVRIPHTVSSRRAAAEMDNGGLEKIEEMENR